MAGHELHGELQVSRKKMESNDLTKIGMVGESVVSDLKEIRQIHMENLQEVIAD